MKTYLDCIPCFFKQGLSAARVANLSKEEQKKVLDGIARIIPDIPMEASPPEIALPVYKSIRKSSGMDDPFRKVKDEHIDFALALYPELKEIVKQSEDPLLTSIRIAIAGNIIDYGVGSEFDIVKTLEKTLEGEFAIMDYTAFKESLKKADSILYIGDNAGETVFDRVLIEKMPGDVIYAVREEPVINDAVVEDAVKSGIGEVATIISSGSDAPGTILSRCNEEFLSYFHDSSMVVAKGQGNYETLSSVKREIYFLLKIKCPVIALDVGVEEGAIVLMRHKE